MTPTTSAVSSGPESRRGPALSVTSGMRSLVARARERLAARELGLPARHIRARLETLATPPRPTAPSAGVSRSPSARSKRGRSPPHVAASAWRAVASSCSVCSRSTPATSTCTPARISSAGDAIPARRRSDATRCIERASSSASSASRRRSCAASTSTNASAVADQHVDAPHLVVPGREVAIGRREVDARRALAAELDQLAEQERGLRAVEAVELARAREVLDLERCSRVRERAGLQQRGFARANLVGDRSELGVAQESSGERIVEPEQSVGFGLRRLGGG